VILISFFQWLWEVFFRIKFFFLLTLSAFYVIFIYQNQPIRLVRNYFRTTEVKDIRDTGISLSLAKELLFLHEEKMFMKTKVGKGSIFSIFLPKMKGSEIEKSQKTVKIHLK